MHIQWILMACIIRAIVNIADIFDCEIINPSSNIDHHNYMYAITYTNDVFSNKSNCSMIVQKRRAHGIYWWLLFAFLGFANELKIQSGFYWLLSLPIICGNGPARISYTLRTATDYIMPSLCNIIILEDCFSRWVIFCLATNVKLYKLYGLWKMCRFGY